MLSRNIIKHILFNQSRCASFVAPEVKRMTPYGNADMPDKLFKNIELEVRSAEFAVMDSYKTFLLAAAKHLDITVQSVVKEKTPKRERWTLLKDVFAKRKHLVQYEVRTYYMWVILAKLTGSTADTYLEYIERMLPEGVALKVTKTCVEPLPSYLKQDAENKEVEKEDLQSNENDK